MYLGCFIGYFRVPSSVHVVLSKAQHTWTGARDEGLTALTRPGKVPPVLAMLQQSLDSVTLEPCSSLYDCGTGRVTAERVNSRACNSVRQARVHTHALDSQFHRLDGAAFEDETPHR